MTAAYFRTGCKTCQRKTLRPLRRSRVIDNGNANAKSQTNVEDNHNRAWESSSPSQRTKNKKLFLERQALGYEDLDWVGQNCGYRYEGLFKDSCKHRRRGTSASARRARELAYVDSSADDDIYADDSASDATEYESTRRVRDSGAAPIGRLFDVCPSRKAKQKRVRTSSTAGTGRKLLEMRTINAPRDRVVDQSTAPV